MDRDAENVDRQDQAPQGDTGMIGSEAEEPGPGRDTSLTDPDPVAASTDQPRGTVAMSEGDPMSTRLGSHVEGAGVIGHDVAAAEEGATTRDTPPGDRPGYEAERPGGDAPVAATAPTAFDRDPGPAAEPVVDHGSYGQDPGVGAAGPGVAASGERVEEAGPSDRSVFADEPPAPQPSAFATEDAGSADRTAVAEDPARFGAGGVGGYQEETERLDRPGPREPGQDGIYDQEQEADQAGRQPPSNG
jgi:hypothetical protein